jgi:hypothetical protein
MMNQLHVKSLLIEKLLVLLLPRRKDLLEKDAAKRVRVLVADIAEKSRRTDGFALANTNATSPLRTR